MFQRTIHENGVVLYRSSLLSDIGVVHAFSTRIGGVSPAPFDSLNLGNPGGHSIADCADNISANCQRLLDAAGCQGRRLRQARQVHGRGVVEVGADGGTDNDAPADALLSDDPGCVVSVRIADCAPILLASEDGMLVAAVHAGWRGVIAGVIGAAVDAMRARLGGRVDGVVAAVGPCIGVDAFEVGPEVVDVFRKAFPHSPPLRPGADGKGFVDLAAAVRRRLIDAGVDPRRIDVGELCTFAGRDEFFSHRRENGRTGRMAAIISPRM